LVSKLTKKELEDDPLELILSRAQLKEKTGVDTDIGRFRSDPEEKGK